MRKNVLEYFEDTVAKYPDKIAIIDKDKSLSFRELEENSKKIGSLISRSSDNFRKPIAVFLPKSSESLIAFLGILYSGNIYTPLDVKSPRPRVKAIIDNLENPLVISSDEYFDTLISIGVKPKNIINIKMAYDSSAVYDNEELTYNLNQVIDMDPVYIIHTSGSTGTPKGVVIPHRGVIDYIDWAIECFDIGPEEIIGSQAPFYFDNSTLDIYLCLATGATLVLIPEQYFVFPVKLLEYVALKGINFIFWVPSVMINIANTRSLDSVDVTCLKKVLFAGEVMPNKHLNYWREKLSGTLFANLYGPTEITVDCTYYIVEKKFEDADKLPIGFPCRNSDILILNEENKLSKKNEMGELCVRGSSLALGYWNNPEKSNDVFIQNPLNKNYFDRIYRTGDLVYLNDDNEIIYVQRKDSQIKHMGYRIELGEIENSILSLDGIFNSCVLYNKDKQEITMFFEGQSDLESGTIRKKLMPLLPKYMLPTKIHKLDKLPMNQNGKVDRKRLAAEWIQS